MNAMAERFNALKRHSKRYLKISHSRGKQGSLPREDNNSWDKIKWGMEKKSHSR